MQARVTRRQLLEGLAILLAATACSAPPTFPDDPTPGPSGDGVVDGYLVTAPRVLRSGQATAVAVSLFHGDRAASGPVSLALTRDGQTLAIASGPAVGHATLSLALPSLPEGDYQLEVRGPGFQDRAPVRVEDGTLVFVETDKPVYKPGQTVHIRLLALDPTLRPASGTAVVEVQDAQGIKVFKRTVTVDDFGLATLDLPLSSEPNLGVWKVKATLGRRSSQVDVRVERYVLPKYEIRLDLKQEWALASEPISGTVAAEYSFGKPVKGEVELVASRFVGSWQEYARVAHPIDGRTTFTLPPVRYAAGSPQGRGLAHVRLEATVREQATGYVEQTSRLITVAAAPVALRVIPESGTFKPGLPLSLLVVAETPDRKPVDASVQLALTYQLDAGAPGQRAAPPAAATHREDRQVSTRNGLAALRTIPPPNAISLTISPSAPNASGARTTVRAGFSPSGSFIHVEPVAAPGRAPNAAYQVGETARFVVAATRATPTIFYEVLARGQVLFADVARGNEIAFTVAPLMAPAARLLVYQVLPNGEVAADFLPFAVQGSYPHPVELTVERPEARPGDELEVRVQTRGAARIGLAAVDRSVFILAEGRLNLEQVFATLERLYLQPQAELHEAEPLGGPLPARPGAPPVPANVGRFAAPGGLSGLSLPGARETFAHAGVLVLTNRTVPEGRALQPARDRVMLAAPAARAAVAPTPAPAAPTVAEGAARDAAEQAAALAEVERVRQLFPETWLWATLTTNAADRAAQRVTVPDSITTWMLRAVALSKRDGLGVAEAQLRVFQPFFVQVDLPYAAVRGEELPARVALYNYQPIAQEFQVALEAADGFDLLDPQTQTVAVGPNEVGAASFRLRPTRLGVRTLKVTARSRGAADAIVKELLVEPEGVQREVVENLVLGGGAARTLRLSAPPNAVPDSARAYLTLTGSVLSQTIAGLEQLLRMPFGCGEQNLVLFAPNVFVARYLKETGQEKPEVLAKAEKLMLTGYQRQLTYRRSDGSFSAFGQQDPAGSLWLTAFVLKTFAQAKELVFVDDAVLASARGWIGQQQRADGSFEPVGFVHHQELLGGLRGKTALTAFVAVALKEAGDDAASGRAARYLEGQLDRTEDPYSLALLTYALALARSARASAAQEKLLRRARESEAGLFWGDPGPQPLGGVASGAAEPAPPSQPPLPPRPAPTAAIETTGYAALALLQLGDRANAARAVRWLATQRNAFGGYGSTQDTIVALQATAAAAATSRADVDATVAVRAPGFARDLRVTADNADVLQVIELPVGGAVTVEARGRGQVLAQSVLRFNLPAAEERRRSAFELDVRYGAEQVEVNDLISVTASVRFTPPEPVAAGMVVLDVAVPTGFAPETPTLDAALQREPKLKRYDLAGRKVVFYLEDLRPEERLTITFQARALYPVRAQAVASQAYSYYRPEWRGESLGGALTVRGRA